MFVSFGERHKEHNRNQLLCRNTRAYCKSCGEVKVLIDFFKGEKPTDGIMVLSCGHRRRENPASVVPSVLASVVASGIPDVEIPDSDIEYVPNDTAEDAAVIKQLLTAETINTELYAT